MSDPILDAIAAMREEMRLRFSALNAHFDELEKAVANVAPTPKATRVPKHMHPMYRIFKHLDAQKVGTSVKVPESEKLSSINLVTARANNYGGKGWVAARRMPDKTIILYKLKNSERHPDVAV